LLSGRIRSDPIINIHRILVKAKKFKRGWIGMILGIVDEADRMCPQACVPSHLRQRWNEIERQQLEKPRNNFIEAEGVA
jgi:hypothetical protein